MTKKQTNKRSINRRAHAYKRFHVLSYKEWWESHSGITEGDLDVHHKSYALYVQRKGVELAALKKALNIHEPAMKAAK